MPRLTLIIASQFVGIMRLDRTKVPFVPAEFDAMSNVIRIWSVVAVLLSIYLLGTSLAAAQGDPVATGSENPQIDQESLSEGEGGETGQEIERTENASTNRINREEMHQKKQQKAAGNWFRSFLGVMVFLYGVQFVFCLRLAKLTRADEATDRRAPTIWDSLWKDVWAQVETWAFVIMAFVLPFMFGIVPDIAALSGQFLREMPPPVEASRSAIPGAGITAQAVYGISIMALTVLITVEFTYLANALNRRIWQRMLMVALALDIISLSVLSYFIFEPKHLTHELGSITILMIAATGFSAFLSSLLIIACVRELGILNVRAMEAKLRKSAGTRRQRTTAVGRKEIAS